MYNYVVLCLVVYVGGPQMTLDEICDEIMDIEEALLYGEISFTYDRLMSAMKAGHPMEILDGIIAEIFCS